jgi:hypothetical protein
VITATKTTQMRHTLRLNPKNITALRSGWHLHRYRALDSFYVDLITKRCLRKRNICRRDNVVTITLKSLITLDAYCHKQVTSRRTVRTCIGR